MPTADRSRRLAAIVAADVAGYSRLMRLDEDGTLAALQEMREKILDPVTSAHAGRVFKTMGDGFMLEFPSVVSAVQCGIEMQSRLQQWNARRATTARMDLRIGINVGDVIAADTDLFGDAVNVAARLEALADPGGIYMSQAVVQQVGDRISMKAEDMGDRALKNIEEPVRVYRIRSSQAAPADTAGPAAAPDAPATIVFPPPRPSLAILPFRSMTAAPEADYIADGISLGIQTLLVQLPNMFFVNACGHAGYRGGEVSAAQALAHMPVRYAVEGSVQQAGDRIRINVQVSDLEQGGVKWAANYDRRLGDIFTLQDEIARSIAGALTVELIGGPTARDFTGGLDSSDAWEHFLRGINFFYRMTRQDHAQAISHFQALAEAHPQSALGPCYLAVLHYYSARRDWAPEPEPALAEAERWARQALPLEDGNNGLAHAVLGALALDRGEHEDSLRMCHTAVAFRASCPFAHGQLGITQTYMGDTHNGIRNLRDALSTHFAGPVPFELNALAVAYRDHGDVDLSISAAQETTRLDPNFVDAYVTLSSDLVLAGKVEQAQGIAEGILRSEPDFSVAGFVEGQPYESHSRRERISQTLRAAGLPN